MGHVENSGFSEKDILETLALLEKEMEDLAGQGDATTKSLEEYALTLTQTPLNGIESNETPAPHPSRKLPLLERIKEEIIAFLMMLKTSLRPKKGITPQGKVALKRLEALSSVYLATNTMSDVELAHFDTAFGEAYFDILFSSTKARQNQQFKEHPEHTRKYDFAVARFLERITC